MQFARRITLLAVLAVSSAGLAQPATWQKDVNVLRQQGRGTPAGRAAWDRLAAGGPELLPFLLEGMDTRDIVAANWVRTAFDTVLDRSLRQKSSKIDVAALLAFVREPTRQGRARRVALEVVEQLRPGTSATLYPGWLEDPEFRYEAVALLLNKARGLLKAGEKAEALTEFRRAFAAARDVPQARSAAAGLQELGDKVSVGRHLGFFVDWHLIGPFDGKGQKSYHLSYPPEKVGFDPAAEYDGQNGKVHWKRYQVREPLPTSGAKHQALVNLRDREALGDADDAVAFALTAFTVPSAQEVEFRGAADDHFVVYVNGVRAFGFEEWRNGVRLDRHRFKVKLNAGRNTVLVKIAQAAAPNPEPNWEFFLRMADVTGRGIAFENALLPPKQ